MMTLWSLRFLAPFFILSGVVLFLPSGRMRQGAWAAFSAYFLLALQMNAASWLVLAAFLLSGYGVAAWVRGVPEGRARSRIVAAYVAGLLVAFIVLKEYRFLGPLVPPGSISRWISIVGLSYMLFRQIHFLVDAADEQIAGFSLWTYLNYQLNVFSLLAGPIQRYQAFAERWHSTGSVLADRPAQLRAYFRLLVGIVKVVLISDALQHLVAAAGQQQLHVRSPREILAFARIFYGFPLYLYFNFSGYCDIAIAGAQLVGLDLPENFNQPYLARNVIDFWNRWHISLTHWVRDYLFTPLYKVGVERRWADPDRWSYVCFFVALVLVGVWHGTTANFAFFGLLHGAGVSVNKIWENRIRRRQGTIGYRDYLQSGPIRGFARFVTFNFVCFTMLFFAAGLKDRAHFIYRFLVEAPAQETAPPAA
jgi:D-alanyl-lipoteichoic acid acyltransferase DltB (MBOAT superfamily)